ncbi:MAG: hypothetical protein IH596_11560 [Bacteroidales bacterium]|nr:hypothetical protein [Bacteroidales bacterium]
MRLRVLTGIIILLFANSLLAQTPDSLAKSSWKGFTDNKGQIIDQNNNPNPSVLYLLNTPGFNVQLRRGWFSYDLYEGAGLRAQSSELRAQGTGSKDEGRGTWDELMTYQDTEVSQGLCPPGWHVPSEVAWNQLFAVYQGNAFAGSPLIYSGYWVWVEVFEGLIIKASMK